MQLELYRHVSPVFDTQDPDAEWLRTAFVDKKLTCVFVPAAIIGCEHKVFEQVEVDGVAFLDNEHVYVKVDWACNVFPDVVDVLKTIEKSVMRVHQMTMTIKNKVILKKYDIQ